MRFVIERALLAARRLDGFVKIVPQQHLADF